MVMASASPAPMYMSVWTWPDASGFRAIDLDGALEDEADAHAGADRAETDGETAGDPTKSFVIHVSLVLSSAVRSAGRQRPGHPEPPASLLVGL